MPERAKAAKDRKYNVIFLIFFTMMCVLGGSSFPDHLLLLLLRPLCCVFLAVFLLWDRPADWAPTRAPALFLGVLAIIIAVQLIPLPPALWLSLPGRAWFGALATAQGIAQPWRPLSLDPDLTINSLLALLPPTVAVVGYAKLSDAERRQLLAAVICFAIASAVLGIIQIATGSASPAYFFAHMTRFLPVGFLGNQNHQAALLALSLPLLAIWVQTEAPRTVPNGVVLACAVAVGLLESALILVTRSRSGAALLVFAALCTAALLFRRPLQRGGQDSNTAGRFRIARVAAIVAIPLLAIALAWGTGRASSFERFFGGGQDLRLSTWPIIAQMTAQYFPFGVGFGAFDVAYRIAEPDALLHPQYFNRAHNDLLEIVLSGGAAAVAFVTAFLVWFAKQAISGLRRVGRVDPWVLRQRSAIIVMTGLMALSLTDYPLRTPSLAVIFAIMTCWLAERRAAVRGRASSRLP